MKKLELNDQFIRAFDLLEHSQKHIFVTGRAGTGKSTLLTYFRQRTKKNIAVLAPTGVAALNVAGQTIHSFFKFRPDVTPRTVKTRRDELYKSLDAIVIDEISMVRADLLDCIDAFMRAAGPHRHLPFGGVQMIFIGDLFQLPPVVTQQERGLFMAGHYASPYFFSAHVVTGGPQQSLMGTRTPFEMEFVELERIYRQTDEQFISVLNNVRANTARATDFELLNSRLQPDFIPPPDIFYIHVTTTNARAKEMNDAELARTPGRLHIYEGTRDGAFDSSSLPTDEILNVKVGAQIMMLNNDTTGRWVNGTIGKISDIESGAADGGFDVLWVKLENGEEVSVTPHTWDLFKFKYDAAARGIVYESAGTFTQYPLKLAWAVTIHKSQGKTFEHVVLDVAGGTFSPGQLYVALSRATTLEGLVLKRPLGARHVFVDPTVVEFCARF